MHVRMVEVDQHQSFLLPCTPNIITTSTAMLTEKISENETNNYTFQQHLEKNKAKGKEVLAMKKQTEQLNANELEKLLLWYCPKKGNGKQKRKPGLSMKIN